MNLTLFNAKPYYDTDTIRETMMEALPAKNEEVLDRILQRYYEDENMHLMGVLDEDENMLGIIGLKLDELGIGTILHLRSNNDSNKNLVYKELINKIIFKFKLNKLKGRASEPLLIFYKSLGFSSRLIGETPPGVNWYGVELEINQ